MWDARGNLIEPHTGKVIPLGGRSVRSYMDGWGSRIEHAVSVQMDTCGPEHRYGTALFVEKEGFTEIEPTAEGIYQMIHELVVDRTLG